MVIYTKREENLNIITHIIGLIMTILLFTPVIVRNFSDSNTLYAVAWIVYMISIGIMFLSSSLYHSMKNETLRMIFRAIDHGVIYLTIAGSYTPIILIGIKSIFAIVIFIIVWILAISGIIMNIIGFAKNKVQSIEKAAIIIYISMGWISLLLIYQIIKIIGWQYIIFLLAGGILYTVGVYFYSKKSIKYNHAIWHIFILFATFSMYLGNLIYLS